MRNQKSRLHLFLDKIAEMALKVDQGHRRWHSSIGHISVSNTASATICDISSYFSHFVLMSVVTMCLYYIVSKIFHRIMACP